MFREIAGRDPDGLALDDGVRRRCWAELDDRTTRAAHFWRSRLGEGDRGAILVSNRVEFVELMLGAQLAGVWVTPVNWHLTPDEVRYILSDSGAMLIATEKRFADVVERATADLTHQVEVLDVDDDLDSALDAASPERLGLDGPFGGLMFYTSGTTGLPKGVRRTGQTTVGAQLEALRAAGRSIRLDGSGPHLVTGPLYHAAPVGFAAMDLHLGAPMVIMDRFDARATLELIDGRGIGGTHLVPTMFNRLLRLDEVDRQRFDGGSLRTVLHGAAPVSVTTKRQMIDWWGPVLVEYWGASEGGVVTLVGSRTWLERPGTVGKPIPGHQVFVTDEAGSPVPSGVDGVLWCTNTKVDRVFEYHGDEEKTKAAFSGPGTYSLGDIGHLDDDGYVYLADRASNLIISGGVNIYPAEIQNVLAEHRSVRDVGVIGIPDDDWGEKVLAVVELEAGFEATTDLADQLERFARERLAGFKVPRAVEFVPELPRLPSGKLAMRHIRDRYWRDRTRRI